MFDFSARTQQAFSSGLSQAIRESRRRQKLTQAEVSSRTNGVVSKTALAAFETGHRQLRVQDLVVVAGALGEDMQVLVSAAERNIPSGVPFVGTERLDIDAAALLAADDPRLAPVKRWLELRGDRRSLIRLDQQAIGALSALMNMRVETARRLLERFTATESAGPPDVPHQPIPTQKSVSGSALHAMSTTATTFRDAAGPVTIRVSQVLASADPQLSVLRSWIEMRLLQSPADRLTVDDGKIAGLALLLETSTTHIRQLLRPFQEWVD